MKSIKTLIENARKPLNKRQINIAKAVIATVAMSVVASPFIGMGYALVGPAFLIAALAVPLANWIDARRLHEGQVN